MGAAVIDLGFATAAFAWALLDGDVLTWDARGLPRVSAQVSALPTGAARFRSRGARVRIDGMGGLDLDVPVDGGRLQATLEVEQDLPAVCVTATPGGGWNTTQKVAGERARVRLAAPGVQATSTGAAWRDWTLGAQDRDTTWRWAAGAGQAADGRRVGLNASTGMNGAGAGEDVVWWDGVPHALDVEVLGPTGPDLDGRWQLSGPDWGLQLVPQGARMATERLVVVRSEYVQPIGRFAGTLPDPTGRPVEVTLVGVTEDHVARW